jgi:menaquinone-dependent protoporphyrinogen oxidase
MSRPVLVTWATRYGSTEEVAQAIATVLREYGFTIEEQPMRGVESLDRYGAVVLGCALYMSRIHGDARRFLSKHREALTQCPVALFVLGPIHADEKEFPVARRQLDKELAKFPRFHPVVQEIFGGRWDPSQMGFPFSWLPAVHSIPVSDARDWDAIQAWARTLPAVLVQGNLVPEPLSV